jgi:hypothetical protein
VLVDGAPLRPASRPPLLGEHNDELDRTDVELSATSDEVTAS